VALIIFRQIGFFITGTGVLICAFDSLLLRQWIFGWLIVILGWLIVIKRTERKPTKTSPYKILPNERTHHSLTTNADTNFHLLTFPQLFNTTTPSTNMQYRCGNQEQTLHNSPQTTMNANADTLLCPKQTHFRLHAHHLVLLRVEKFRPSCYDENIIKFRPSCL